MATYNIWCEGYNCTGNASDAHCFGQEEGETFQEACDTFFSKHPQGVYYSKNRGTYWGCKLFPDEASARKAFG